MEGVLVIIKDYIPHILIALTVLSIIFIILIIVLFVSLSKVKKKYRKLMRGVNASNLEENIIKYLDEVEDVKVTVDVCKNEYSEIKRNLKNCVQNVAIVRYKAFEDVGSDLSYSIVLLDDNSDGVILTSIFGRNESTTYAKPINKGISRYDLSSEEQEVLNSAVGRIK